MMHDAAVAGIVLAVRRFPVRDAAGHFEDLERDHQPQTDIRIVEIQREDVLDLLNAVDDAVAVHVHMLGGQGDIALRAQEVIQELDVAADAVVIVHEPVQIVRIGVFEGHGVGIMLEHVLQIVFRVEIGGAVRITALADIRCGFGLPVADVELRDVAESRLMPMQALFCRRVVSRAFQSSEKPDCVRTFASFQSRKRMMTDEPYWNTP